MANKVSNISSIIADGSCSPNIINVDDYNNWQRPFHPDVLNYDICVFNQCACAPLLIKRGHNIIYDIQAEYPVIFKIGSEIVSHDCRNKPITDPLMPILYPFNSHNLILTVNSDNPENIKISFKDAELSPKLYNKIAEQAFTILKPGTIIKRLQNPEKPLGFYFTHENGDLERCGVSQYYINSSGLECQKIVLHFKVIKETSAYKYIADDTFDDWSTGLKEKCPGGELIYNLPDTTTITPLKDLVGDPHTKVVDIQL